MYNQTFLTALLASALAPVAVYAQEPTLVTVTRADSVTTAAGKVITNLAEADNKTILPRGFTLGGFCGVFSCGATGQTINIVGDQTIVASATTIIGNQGSGSGSSLSSRSRSSDTITSAPGATTTGGSSSATGAAAAASGTITAAAGANSVYSAAATSSTRPASGAAGVQPAGVLGGVLAGAMVVVGMM